MVNDPVIHFFIPLSHFLILLVLFWRNEIVDNHVFELELISEFIDGIEHVISLPVEVFLSSVELCLGFVILQ